MITAFVLRNPRFSILNVRNLYSVRKAMKTYAAGHPNCAYCGRKQHIDVHHIIPVKNAPHLAGDYNNFISLCRKPACHLIVGHRGNWKDSNPNVREICKLMNK
jgi:5-methylcytosine-specific restriction endonuclease McrA